ncbi:MAG: DUF3488 and transglutaminase-like domain-containing protein [Hydrogenothermaceae bacterium]|nr:DUF3488 and transglutaminase-like domain-containing protein [Hydrogenothermaceae bacterium]
MKKIYSLESLVKINTYLGSVLIFILVLPHTNLLYNFSFLLLFSLAFYRDFFRELYIPRIFLNISAIILLIFMALQINISNLILPIIETLLLLLSLKLLENKKFRDYMQVYLLIALIFAGYSMISISMVFLLYLLIYLFLLNFSIITLTYYTQGKNLDLSLSQIKNIAFKSSIIPFLAIPVSLLLFFLIPRTNYPMLNILSQQPKGKAGFSDEVSLGEVSSIQENNGVAMRVAMENIGEIYIRGITFNKFDGKRWENTVPDSLRFKREFSLSKKITYTAYLEPTYENYLFTIDIPYRVDLGKFNKDYYPYLRKDLTFTTTMPISQRVMYKGWSILSDRYYEETATEYYLLLPEVLSESVLDYGRKLKGKDSYETATNILRELYRYQYSLSDLPVGENQVEEFLFKKKKGNCEYFATAMVIMLRINGIPSRVVGGYKTNTYNDIGKYYLVKQKDAHLWVEAYIDNYWIRFDPTPPVREEVVQTIDRPSRLKLFFDSVNYYYNAFIVNYDFSKQMSLYKGIKERVSEIPKITFSLREKVPVLLSLLSIFSITVLILTIYRNLRRSYEERILNLFYRKLKRYGYTREKAEGLEEFCSKIEEEDLRVSCLLFVKELEKHIYGKEKLSVEDFRRLKQMLGEIGKDEKRERV